MAVMGQRGECFLPMTMVCSYLKGSAFDTFKHVHTNLYFDEHFCINVMSFS